MVTRTGICFKCGESGKVYGHHLHKDDYAIEGDSRVVDCCMSCHTIIHQEIRKRKACPLSPAETDILSQRSSNRRNKRTISFSETLMPNVSIFENIIYEINTGHVYVAGYFSAYNEKELKYIEA